MEMWATVSLVLVLGTMARAACFFPTEVQGSYAVQHLEHGGDTSDVWYKSVSVSYDVISGLGGLGRCVFRRRERYVLQTEAGCFTCATLSPRSYNVLSLERGAQCHESAESAWLSCGQQPGAVSMLYRAGNKIRPQQCPLTGRFTVSCGEGGAEGAADTCPDESQLSAECGGRSYSYTCLGSWRTEAGAEVVALLDRVLPQLGEAARPRWVCGSVVRGAGGRAEVTLSNDSTCTSPGQRLVLTPLEAGHQQQEEEVVELPGWAQGAWDSVTVSGARLEHRSQQLLATHTLEAVQSHRHGLYTVRVTTGCGTTGYACLDLMGRGEHGRILELVLGRVHGSRAEVRCGLVPITGADQLLRVTQLRHAEHCPMPGEWRGTIPDGEGLCARSVTSCAEPSVMRYQVYSCADTAEVYEEREYECYGQYAHGGQVYTLTKRRDLLHQQECFVGVTSASGEHRVLEAGAHCERGLQPRLYGMVMEPVRPLQCDRRQDPPPAPPPEPRPLHPKLRLASTPSLDPPPPPEAGPRSGAAPPCLSVIPLLASLLFSVYSA